MPLLAAFSSPPHRTGRPPIDDVASLVARRAPTLWNLPVISRRGSGGTCRVGAAQRPRDVGRGRRVAAAPQAPEDAGAAVCGSRRRLAAPDPDPRTPRPRRPVAIPPAAPRPVPTATPASAAVTTGASSSAAPNPVTTEPVNPTAGPETGPVTAMPPTPAPSDIPAPQAATEPEAEPEPTATPDHPVTPAATTLAPTHPDAAESTPLTPAATQPAPPEPTPDQPADALRRARSDAVPAASAQASVTPVTPAA
jgi:hypothetical protein